MAEISLYIGEYVYIFQKKNTKIYVSGLVYWNYFYKPLWYISNRLW